MRADRLVATLLLLQARGRVTAAEVAGELEVSERTARRDLEALGTAGIPVYSQPGRGGGWSLVGGARTDLTGFRSVEARALVTMAAASGTATPEFSSAIRKLVRALPEPIRVEAERAMAAVLADDSRWGSDGPIGFAPRLDHLDPLQGAVIERRQVRLGYDTPGKGMSYRVVHPLGLVVKRSVWYLLADTADGQRSFRVDRVVDVDVLDAAAVWPDEFDLGAAWEAITAGYQEQFARIEVGAVIEQWTVPALRSLGVDVSVEAGRDDGRLDATLRGMSTEVFAAEIAGVVHGIELVDAPEVEARLAEIGEHLVSRFGAGVDR